MSDSINIESENINDIELYKVENEKLKRDQEKCIIDYEIKIQNFKNDISGKTFALEEIKNNYNELNEKYKIISNEKIELSKTIQELQKVHMESNKKYDQLEFEYNSIVQSLQLKDHDLKYYKNEVNALKDSIAKYKSKEIELSIKDKEIDYKSKEYENYKILDKNQINFMKEEIENLKERLVKMDDDRLKIETDFMEKFHNLNIELENKRLDNKKLIIKNEKLMSEIENVEKVNDEKCENLRFTVENESNQTNILRNEIQIQQSMVELYKEERDECLSKEAKIIKAFTELQSTLRESYSENEKLKDEYQSRLQKFTETINTYQNQLEVKSKELINANELIEQFRVKGMSEQELKSLNPATSAAIGALKRGYSITQIYSEYLQMSEELKDIKVERDRLNEYVKSIYDEIELKTEKSRKGQCDESNLQLVVSDLNKRHEEIINNLMISKSELSDYEIKYDELKKKNEKYTQVIKDLSQQICVLLAEIETRKGTVIRHSRSYLALPEPNKGSNCSFNRESDGQGVITQHMVSFKDINDLQQKNQLLILQLRELTKQQEKVEEQIRGNSIDNITDSFYQSMSKIDELETQLKEKQQLVKLVESQKHMIIALTNIANSSESCLKLDGDSWDNLSNTLLVAINDKSNVNLNKEIIEELKQKLSLQEKKYFEINEELNCILKSKDSEKELYNNKINDLNEELNNLKINIAHLTSKLNNNQDLNQKLEQNLINRQLELEDTKLELNDLQIQLQQKMDLLSNTKTELNLTINQLKTIENNARQSNNNSHQFDMLMRQIEIERQEKNQLISITSNLSEKIESIQTSFMEKSLNMSVDHLSNDEAIEYKTEIRTLKLELKNQNSLFETSKEIWKAKQIELQTKIDSLTTQLNNKKSKVISDITEDIDSESQETIPFKDYQDWEKSVEELSSINRGLSGQVQSLRKLLKESEDRINENAGVIDSMHLEYKEKIEFEQNKNTEQQEILNSLKTCYDSLTEEYDKLKADTTATIQQLTESLASRETKISTLHEQITKYEELEKQLTKDLERLRESSKTYSKDYHDELSLHLEDSHELKKVTELLKKYQKQEKDSQDRLKKLDNDNVILKSELEGKIIEWNTEKENLVQKISELSKERDSLNEHTIELNSSVVTLKKLLDPSIHENIDKSIIEKECDWNDVVRYLRDEKNNAEQAKNNLDIDLHKANLQIQQLEEKNKHLQALIDEERSFKSVETEINRKHRQVMQELEQIAIIKESNIKLREDRKMLIEELEEKSDKLKEMKSLVEPLNEKVKLREKEIEAIKIENSCMEKERNIWRTRSSDLIDRLNKVNPEDFKKLCNEKDELESKINQMEATNANQINNIAKLQETIDELKKEIDYFKTTLEENQTIIQSKETLITQLKEIGRKYKTETEALKKKIDDSDDEKKEYVDQTTQLKQEIDELKQSLNQKPTTSETTANESQERHQQFLQNLGQLLNTDSNQLSIIESIQKLSNDQANRDIVKKDYDEIVLRKSMMEKRIVQLSQENEKLRIQSSTSSFHKIVSTTDEDIDHNSNVTSTNNPIVSAEMIISHTSSNVNPITVSTTPIARVTASIQPSIVKAQPIMSQASLSSSNNNSLPRQTVEIRPIAATVVNPVNEPQSTITSNPDNSLSATVMQTLSSTTVIFPGPSNTSSATAPSSLSDFNNSQQRPIKRTINEINTEPSTTSLFDNSNPFIKKPRLNVLGASSQSSLFTSNPIVCTAPMQSNIFGQTPTTSFSQTLSTSIPTPSQNIEVDVLNIEEESNEEPETFDEDLIEEIIDEDDIEIEDDSDEENSEDDEEMENENYDDEDDDEPAVIELSSSMEDEDEEIDDDNDEEEDDDNDNLENKIEDQDQSKEDVEAENFISSTDPSKTITNLSKSDTSEKIKEQNEDIEAAKKKIQPIIWHGSVSTNSGPSTISFSAGTSSSAVIKDDQTAHSIPVLQTDLNKPSGSNVIPSQIQFHHSVRQSPQRQRSMNPQMIQNRTNFFRKNQTTGNVNLGPGRAIRSRPYRHGFPRR